MPGTKIVLPTNPNDWFEITDAVAGKSYKVQSRSNGVVDAAVAANIGSISGFESLDLPFLWSDAIPITAGEKLFTRGGSIGLKEAS